MEVDKFSIHVLRLPEVPFMAEAHFFKTPLGRHIAPLNHGIDSMQVINGECQSGKMCDRLGSYSLVPILFFANDNAYFAASMAYGQII
jgi:hypothetical protein